MKKSTGDISKWFMDLKLTTKIIICYSVAFITFFVIITFSYQQISNDNTVNKVSEMSAEIVESIGYNFNFIIDTVNNQSKILISNRALQDTLNSGNTDFNNHRKRKAFGIRSQKCLFHGGYSGYRSHN